MNWVSRNCWVAGLLLVANARSAETTAHPDITVWIYNYAGIDGEALARAKEAASLSQEVAEDADRLADQVAGPDQAGEAVSKAYDAVCDLRQTR